MPCGEHFPPGLGRFSVGRLGGGRVISLPMAEEEQARQDCALGGSSVDEGSKGKGRLALGDVFSSKIFHTHGGEHCFWFHVPSPVEALVF